MGNYLEPQLTTIFEDGAYHSAYPLRTPSGDFGLDAVGFLFGGDDTCISFLETIGKADAARNYQPLIDHLVDDLGYVPGHTLFGAPYDWREDFPRVATQLDARVDEALAAAGTRTATVVAHSLGAGAMQYALEHQPGLPERIGRMIYVGGAIRGASLGIQTHKFGYDMGVPGMTGPARRMSADWGSVYFASPYQSYYDRLAEVRETPYEEWPLVDHWAEIVLPHPDGAIQFDRADYTATLPNAELAAMPTAHHDDAHLGARTGTFYVVGVGRWTPYRVIDAPNLTGPLYPRTNGDKTIPAFAQFRDDGEVFCLDSIRHHELIGDRAHGFMGHLVSGQLHFARQSPKLSSYCRGPSGER